MLVKLATKFVLGYLMMVAAMSTTVFASSLDYGTTQSLEQAMMCSRNAATDGADAVKYNPAGTVKMADGLYVNISNMVLFLKADARDDFSKHTYEGEAFSAIYPAMFGIYKSTDYAFFLGFTILGGGASANFDEGVPMYDVLAAKAGLTVNRDNSYVKVSPVYLGYTAGTALAINGMVSVSVAGRVVQAKKEIDASLSPNLVPVTYNTELEQSGIGYGGILGINVTPTNGINIALTVESMTKLKLKNDTTRDQIGALIPGGAGWEDGKTTQRNLPWVLMAGIEYYVSPSIKLSTSFTYYLIKPVDEGKDDGIPDDWENGYDVAVGMEYSVLTQLSLTAGYLYSKVGGNEDVYSEFFISPNFHQLGFGLRLKAIQNLTLNTGISYVMYEKDIQGRTVPGVGATYNKSLWGFGFGAEYRFL